MLNGPVSAHRAFDNIRFLEVAVITSARAPVGHTAPQKLFHERLVVRRCLVIVAECLH